MSAAPGTDQDMMVTMEDDSMVRYGGLLGEEEDDELERIAMCKSVFKGRIRKKALVCSQFHLFGYVGSITSLAKSHQDHIIKVSSTTHQEGNSKWQSQMMPCSSPSWN
jgi:hypothetical protein